jgi:two-component system sensor histidine kinase MprB
VSLRSRLAILFGLVGLVASGLVGAISFRSTAGQLDQSTDRFLGARASETALAVTNATDTSRPNNGGNGGQGRRPQRPGRFTDGLPVADDDAIIQYTGPGGIVLTSSLTLPSTAAAQAAADDRPERDEHSSDPRFEDIEIDGESYRMASVGLAEGGVIQVARATGENDQLSATLLRRFLAIAGGVALMSAAVGWLIASRTTAPLRRLATVASDVATTGDFTTDVGDDERTDEIGRLAVSFRSMLDALEASRQQQHRLIHDAGHELRTPLTSMRANVELLERAVDLPVAERTEVLAAIGSELVELSALFDEMIELATDQRDDEIASVPIDLDHIVRDVAATWQRRSDRPITVHSSSSIVMGDPAMLERALTNLVNNADKFSPPGTPIEIVAGEGSVSVRDSGPGIPLEERLRVFDRFYRTEVTRSMPGSGLGLSIVAQVVQRHGGEVWVSDSPSGGADIGFRLPVS